MTNLRHRWTLFLLLSLAAVPATADEIVRGVVVSTEAGEIYFDIGKATGLAPGAPLRIKRPVQLKHPVTGAAITDELPLAEAVCHSVSGTLARATPPADVAARIRVGDVVEAYVEKAPAVAKVAAPPPPVAPPPSLPPAEPLPGVDAATAELVALFNAGAGMPPAERITLLEDYLARHPDSPYAAAIDEDLTLLRRYRAELEVGAATAESVTLTALEHLGPARAPGHEPLGLVFAVAAPDELRLAWLHVRRIGSETYRRVRLTRDGEVYLRATVPADLVEGPGIEYFVEAATPSGLTGSALGTPRIPVSIAIADPGRPVFVADRGRSRVSLHTTYLDYATWTKPSEGRTDRFFLVEADVLYRLRTVLYGVRVGFGALNGEVGDTATGVSEGGFNYGYLELEFLGGDKPASVAGRLVAGLGDEGVGWGVEGRVRVGKEAETNLSFAASTLAELGFLSELHLQWAVIPRFPLGFAVAVTDQPNAGDVGVRFSADVGVRIWSWFQPTLRVSYQGRTVEHSGLGGGLGLVFDW